MKVIKSTFGSTLVLLLLHSCAEKTNVDNPKSNSYAGTFQLANTDTINKTDGAGLKQGHWVVTDYFSPVNKPVTIESGDYVDNKKQGIWNYYDSAGAISRTVEYKDDFPMKK